MIHGPALSVVLHKLILFRIDCEHCALAKKKKEPGQRWMPLLDFCVCVCVPTACLAACVLRVSMYALVCVSSEGKFLSQGWGFFLS